MTLSECGKTNSEIAQIVGVHKSTIGRSCLSFETGVLLCVVEWESVVEN